jgi:hypothetical protein
VLLENLEVLLWLQQLLAPLVVRLFLKVLGILLLHLKHLVLLENLEIP